MDSGCFAYITQPHDYALHEEKFFFRNRSLFYEKTNKDFILFSRHKEIGNTTIKGIAEKQKQCLLILR